MEELGSETSHAGQLFSVRLAEPIIIDEHVVALVGAAGVGEVVHAAPANSMGRAGELILAARYVEAAGTRIPLRRLRFERSGAPGQLSFQMMNGGAWVNTTPGRDINVTPGTILTAQVATAVFAPVD